MESMEELKKICQKPHYKTRGNWMARNITRDMALPITRLLLFLPVTANGVTTLSLVTIAVAAYFYAQGSPAAFAIGSAFFQLWYLLDHVDGQVARYRKSASYTGVFYDFMTHHLVNLLVFSSLGYGLFRATGRHEFLLGGFAVSVSITAFHLVYDAQYKAIFGAFFERATAPVFSKPSGTADPASRDTAARRVFSFLHKLCEVHVAMNILTAVSLFGWLRAGTQSLELVLSGYLLVAPVVFTVKMVQMLRTQAVDRLYEQCLRGKDRSK